MTMTTTTPPTSRPLRVALVGDPDDGLAAHRAIPRAIRLACEAQRLVAEPRWLHTDMLVDARMLDGADALWLVPGSPYRRMSAALDAVRFAREHHVPFLGTCAGMQHALIEVARHVHGLADADHRETAPDAACAVVDALARPLVEADEAVTAVDGSRLAAAHAGRPIRAVYHCRFGPSPAHVAALTSGPLRAAAHGPGGEVRAVELDAHPFFVATLWQPERDALDGRAPPIVEAWLAAAAAHRRAG